MLTLQSHSEEQTYEFGKWIGANVQSGDIILLFGDLGSGKTVLSRGIAHGVGFTGRITSPTFTLMHTYLGRIPVYHFDIYRLNEPDELFDLDYEEYLYGNGISIVEWPERLGYLLPEEYLKITITRQLKENDRNISLKPVGSRYAALEEVLKNYEGIGN
ncbi:MAG: tRNA (adenosine(37)-N6)-threonylcarbamoyltransferase complex ATPase subunit type 1 TsaE [Caldicoprobacterales bacterium]|jgi:tRNA threonylcarbamoyladenosine biosynthesis protein TsaE|nr:tRNA (adenosine(37)-N6)-threonylcarbamoyltransferase complex ATPase subunit type 1 TsaE [Clostridiales bacterium]